MENRKATWVILQCIEHIPDSDLARVINRRVSGSGSERGRVLDSDITRYRKTRKVNFLRLGYHVELRRCRFTTGFGDGPRAFPFGRREHGVDTGKGGSGRFGVVSHLEIGEQPTLVVLERVLSQVRVTESRATGAEAVMHLLKRENAIYFVTNAVLMRGIPP